MLKAKGTIDGRETLILGLTAANVKRLQGNQPIHFHGESCKIDVDVMILYGEDEVAIAGALGIGKQTIDNAARETAIEPDENREAPLTPDRNDESAPPRYLIWSNEHAAWWRSTFGYTQFIEEARRYRYKDAQRIVNDANCALQPDDHKNETMVRAPEDNV